MARIIFIFCLSCFICSCGGSYKTSDTGLKYKFYIQNQGVKKPRIGEVMYLHYTINNSNGEQLFSTYQNRNGKPDVLMLEKPNYQGDYFEALAMMSVGDSATFLILADSFYNVNLKRPLPNEIESGSKLMFNIRLVDVMSKEDAEKQKYKEKLARYDMEYKQIVNYMQNHNLKLETLLPSGIKYKLTENGSEKLDSGDIATIHYKGKLLDGTEFVNTYTANQPQPFELGKPYEIEFYNLVLPLLGNGEKGTFIIPFVYAFGEMGVNSETPVPPYSTVIYEIEVIKTKYEN
jgi:FKBP-type peptidyl-prolyl cis-trans isomerase